MKALKLTLGIATLLITVALLCIEGATPLFILLQFAGIGLFGYCTYLLLFKQGKHDNI